ncbi:hypothetical protein [Pseudomonas pergaminensis]|uniref:Uncharacterized protein n=1 Tax=Pseudomonas pergaminensis TaxID=2853159 RepID=A0ABW8R6Q7_9PSED
MEIIVNESEILVFLMLDEAEDFLADERHKWHWLTKLPTHLSKAAKEIQTILVDKPIIQATGGLRTSLLDKIKIGTKEEPFITRTSDEGKFISEVISNYDYTVGFFSIIYSNDYVRDLAYNNSVISEALRMPRFEYDRVTAMNLSLSLGNHERFLGAIRKSSFQELLDEQRSEQQEFRSTFKEITEKFTNAINEQSSEAKSNILSTKKILSRRMNAIKALSKRGTRIVQEAADTAKEKHETALERLKAADAAYTEQLELKYSVKYWKGRKIAHTLSKYGWLLSVFFSLGLMLASVSLYFANGGLVTISENLSERFPSSLIITPKNNKPIDTQTSSINSAFTKSEIANVAANITGAVLLITILSIFIRITLRQFSIHTQCALEAGERVTFIKTYLALMHENQIKSDEDRKLILECIFKSTLGTSTPEIAFSFPIDSIIKALGDKKAAS